MDRRHSQTVRRAIVRIVLFFIAASPLLAKGDRSVHYSVSIPNPASETFSVEAGLRGVTGDTLTYFFPIWAPGAYDIVYFGRYVSDFTARDATGKSLGVIRVDSSTYKIVAPPSDLRLSYTVHDIERIPNSAWFGLSDIEDTLTMAFANGPALFGYPDGWKETPHSVTYTPPEGWDLAVGLEEDDDDDTENTFTAASYDELADAPVQMGRFQRFEFEVDDKPHVITVTSPEPLTKTTSSALVSISKKLVEIYSEFFGEMPYERYLFQHYLEAPKDGGMFSYGALEHANSSTYLMPWFGQEAVPYMLMPVIAHEYWHLWSPKRVHVDELGPFNYQAIPRTTSLWFHEGITEYYARLLPVRHGLSTRLAFLEQMKSDITPLYGADQKSTIAELSYHVAERPLSEIIDLYQKGPVLGFILDAEIRRQTGNNSSLDDAMRYFVREYGDHNGGKNFGDEDIIGIIETATGAELDDFYKRFIVGTDALPFDEVLPGIGLRYEVTNVTEASFGARLKKTSNGWRIESVTDGLTVQASGMQVGDTILGFIVKVEGEEEFRTLAELGLTTYRANEWLQEVAPSLSAAKIRRNGKEMALPLKIKGQVVTFGRLIPDTEASEEAVAARDAMIGEFTDEEISEIFTSDATDEILLGPAAEVHIGSGGE